MVSEELVQRLERLADQVDINQLLAAIYNGMEEVKKDLEKLKKAAQIEEEPKKTKGAK